MNPDCRPVVKPAFGDDIEAAREAWVIDGMEYGPDGMGRITLPTVKMEPRDVIESPCLNASRIVKVEVERWGGHPKGWRVEWTYDDGAIGAHVCGGDGAEEQAQKLADDIRSMSRNSSSLGSNPPPAGDPAKHGLLCCVRCLTSDEVADREIAGLWGEGYICPECLSGRTGAMPEIDDRKRRSDESREDYHPPEGQRKRMRTNTRHPGRPSPGEDD